MDASQIRRALEKLNVLGRVLYIAAHPDDENTGLIAYWENGALYDAGYLSLTRGDGGQNLIGPELRDELGVIRTQELLAARRVDSGQQFFTRAIDFGFSKSAEETLRLWDRKKILADVVCVMRKFRPDIVVTRFPTNDTETHGHHTASAQLAAEAFKLAGDPKRFPEQLKLVSPWQPKRLLWNSWAAFRAEVRREPLDVAGLIPLEVGGYQPLLGRSFPEIAAASRSMHKSQGFGVEVRRGERKEYFQFLDGESIPEGKGIFAGIDSTWARVPKSDGVADQINRILKAFDDSAPWKSVPALIDLRRKLRALGDEFWAREKLAESDEIVAACLGLHLAAVTEKPMAQPGEKLGIQIEAMNRAPVEMKFRSIQIFNDPPKTVAQVLSPNDLVTEKVNLALPDDLAFSEPYWLRESGTTGTYNVSDQTLIGRPESPPPFPIEASFEIAGEEIRYPIEPRFRKVDRVAGEVSQPLVIAPPALVQLPRPVLVFGDTQPRRLNLRVIAASDKFHAQVALEVPSSWKIEPASVPVNLESAESEVTCTFQVTPPQATGEGTLRAVFISDRGKPTPAFGRQRIDYPHIEPQTLINPAEARLVRAKIANQARRIGYIPGAGDAMAESLREIGCEVQILGEEELKAPNLAQFDAVVLGVRAYNVHPERIGVWYPELRAYAEQGGVVVVQYNTMPGPKPDELPHPLRVSHNRVTDETAPVRILAPDHPVMNSPNKITAADFDGWVQERGLYFPDQWDAAWTAIFSSNDSGEKPLDGGLLVTRVGKGWFVYTGYSWFRELPAGVPGAYRIFANMISLGKANRAE